VYKNSALELAKQREEEEVVDERTTFFPALHVKFKPY